MAKVLICDPVAAKSIEMLQDAGLDVVIKDDITAEDLIKEAGEYDAMVVRSRTKVTKEVLDAATNLKIIVRGGVGLDNIDREYAKTKDVKVSNTPTASTNSVAEMTVGYLFCLARKLPQATMSMTAGEWAKKKLKGTEIAGKTLGLIGCGHIGQAVAERAAALGMKVIFSDVVCPTLECAEQCDLDTVISQSDYISLHVPLLESTRHIIDADAISKMKDGAYVINCGRGGTVDEDALYEALKSGKLAGAALDVYEDEKQERGAKLFTLKDDNGFNLVIGSPHVGASTKEGQARVGVELAQIIIDFFK